MDVDRVDQLLPLGPDLGGVEARQDRHTVGRLDRQSVAAPSGDLCPVDVDGAGQGADVAVPLHERFQ